MVELKGFYNEDVLEELLYNEEITRLEAVYHHSQERINDFKAYCQKRGLQEDEAAAEQYGDFILKRQENAHTELLD